MLLKQALKIVIFFKKHFIKKNLILLIFFFFLKDENVFQQNLGFYLGRNLKKSDMASIYMIYNDTTLFTRFETINEWFEYAHGNIDAVGLRDFPIFTSDKIENRITRKKNDQVKSEEIFHLPSLQVLCDSTQENSN